jgi:NrS-1  polymerase HBD domain
MSGAINPAEINAELRGDNQWATHRAKVPYISGTERKASSTDPTTWGSFDDARAAVEAGKADGLYYALKTGSGIVGVDLDHCVENGAIAPWAMVYVRLLNSYTCLSTSLTGIRMFVKGTKPSTDCKRGAVECYDHDRLLSMTDQRVPGTPDTVEERQGELEAFYKLAFPPKAKPERKAAPAPATSSASAITLTDDERFAAAMRSDEFARLHRGDIGGHASDSEARISYLNRAAFYSGKNPAAMERWIRSSSLNSAKFDDRRGDTTFLATEIADACDYVSETYTPGAHWPTLTPTPLERIEQSGNDGAELVCLPRAELDRLIAENADLRAGYTRMAAVLRNKELVGSKKLAALVATFEIVSMDTRDRKDRRLSSARIAEKAGISPSAASAAMKLLSGPDGVFIRDERWEKINPYTGEIHDVPHRIASYHPKFASVSATMTVLADFKAPTEDGKQSWGGPREKTITLNAAECLCADHPEAGSAVHCAACNRSLAVAVPADPERWRPSEQDDFMGNHPPERSVVTSMKQQDAQMGLPLDPAAHGVDVSLSEHLDPMANLREPDWLFENAERIAATASARLDELGEPGRADADADQAEQQDFIERASALFAANNDTGPPPRRMSAAEAAAAVRQQIEDELTERNPL